MKKTDFEHLQQELQGKTVIVSTDDAEFAGLWVRTMVNAISIDLAVVLRIKEQEMFYRFI